MRRRLILTKRKKPHHVSNIENFAGNQHRLPMTDQTPIYVSSIPHPTMNNADNSAPVIDINVVTQQCILINNQTPLSARSKPLSIDISNLTNTAPWQRHMFQRPTHKKLD